MITDKTQANPILLIDADMLLYRVAAGLQHEVDWGDDIVSVTTDVAAAKNVVDEEMNRIHDELNGSPGRHRMCFTDPNHNFRKDIYPDYKSGRGRKPAGYRKLVEHCFELYNCLCLPGLEADDVMGIMATDKLKKYGVMVSGDKDLLTIPGRHYPLYGGNGWSSVTQVDAQEAHYNHMTQTLCGDSTDGYPGCKGVGPKTAAKILDGGVGNLWSLVLETYLDKGFDEDFAITQAQLARILHSEDLTDGGRSIIPWRPKPDTWIPTDLEIAR